MLSFLFGENMISLKKLLDIVCTEAIEYGGLQEVPDRVDGAMDHYHSLKRNARGESDYSESITNENLPPMRFDLELIEKEDGTLQWEE